MHPMYSLPTILSRYDCFKMSAWNNRREAKTAGGYRKFSMLFYFILAPLEVRMKTQGMSLASSQVPIRPPKIGQLRRG